MTRGFHPVRRFALRDAGFSLIELIVSLALLAMILALLPGAFRTGKRGWETAAVLEQRAMTDTSVDFLRHRLAQATPLFDRDKSGRARLAFSGGPSEVNFVAIAPSGPNGGGLYRFGVTVQPGATPASSALVLRMTPFRQQGLESAAPASEHVLKPGIGSLQLRYFGSPTEGGEAVWSDVWQRDDRLPELVELFAVSNTNGARSLGPLRVELKLRSTVNP